MISRSAIRLPRRDHRLRAADGVLDVDDAPLPLQAIAIRPAVAGAAAVVHVEHREAAAGPELDLRIEHIERRAGRTAMGDDDQRRLRRRRRGDVGIGRRVVERVHVAIADLEGDRLRTEIHSRAIGSRRRRSQHAQLAAPSSSSRSPAALVGEPPMK